MNPTLRTLRKHHDKANGIIHGMNQQSLDDGYQKKRASHVWKWNMVSVMAREALVWQEMLASRVKPPDARGKFETPETP